MVVPATPSASGLAASPASAQPITETVMEGLEAPLLSVTTDGLISETALLHRNTRMPIMIVRIVAKGYVLHQFPA